VSRLLHADKIDYQGIVAVVLAASVGITLMVATIGIIWQRRSLSEAGGEVLIGLIGTVVGGLVGYLAGKSSSTPDTPESQTEAAVSRTKAGEGDR
jgi:hypothetical protein